MLVRDLEQIRGGRETCALTRQMKRAGRVVSRAALIDAAWGGEQEVGPNTLDVFIFQLRTKLEAGGAPRLLHTVRGFGYVLRETEIS